MIYDGFEPFIIGLVIEFLRTRLFNPGHVSCSFDHGQLHTKADAHIGDFAGARKGRRPDHPFRAAFSEAAGDEDRMKHFQMGARIFAFEYLGVQPFGPLP